MDVYFSKVVADAIDVMEVVAVVVVVEKKFESPLKITAIGVPPSIGNEQ